MKFTGKYKFLSNFQELEKPIIVKGTAFNTTENAYQAVKTGLYAELTNITPAEAKNIVKELKKLKNMKIVKV